MTSPIDPEAEIDYGALWRGFVSFWTRGRMSRRVRIFLFFSFPFYLIPLLLFEDSSNFVRQIIGEDISQERLFYDVGLLVYILVLLVVFDVPVRIFDLIAGFMGLLRRKPQYLLYAFWVAVLVVGWGLGLTLSVRHVPMDGLVPRYSEADGRWAMVGVLLAVTLLSYLPVLLFSSFFLSEQPRGRENAIWNLRRNGWSSELENDVNAWYSTVFRFERYPIPVTMALLTLIAGWSFAFFHSGLNVVESLAVDGHLASLINAPLDGPPVLYAFFGSYFFCSWLLFGRYISGDLGPGVFVHVCIRTWGAVLLALVITAVWNGLPVVAPNATTPVAIVAGKDSYNTALLILAFVGGTTPTVLFGFLTSQAARMPVIKGVVKQNDDEMRLELIDGLSRLKAARLAEEGIENMQNLATEDPARLVVVTQESGVRILQWIDQAMLYHYVSNEAAYRALTENGIRTAYELYVSFRDRGLIGEMAYGTTAAASSDRVSSAPAGASYWLIRDSEHELDASTQKTASVLLSIVHQPNFQKIKQMYEASNNRARAFLQPQLAAVSEKLVESSPAPPRRPPRRRRGEAVAGPPPAALPTAGALLVQTAAPRSPTAMAVLVTPSYAIGPSYLPTVPLVFQRTEMNAEHKEVVIGDQVGGKLVVSDTSKGLALYALENHLEGPVELAPDVPAPWDTLRMFSWFNGERTGRVTGSVTSALGLEEALLTNLESKPGDGGAPIYDAQGRLAGIQFGRTLEAGVAVPVSVIQGFVADTLAGLQTSPVAAPAAVESNGHAPEAPVPALGNG